MNQVNISKIDLNLLLVFDAVMTEKNTVRAAERLNLSQPAISHALNRLRDLLGDRLFVRASRGVIPTTKALKLEKPVRDLLALAEGVFFDKKDFDPLTAERTVRIATTDYFEHIVLPKFLQRMEKEAPRMTFISRPTGGEIPKAGLESGDFDLGLAGFYADTPPRFFQQKLFTDDFVCLSHKDNRIGRETLTVEQYAKQRHILISPQGDLQSRSREIMRKMGHELFYAAGVTGYLSPVRILNLTDLLLTCPRRLAQVYKEHFPVKVYELPFKIPPITVTQVWHERVQDDPAQKWLRQMLREVAATV